MRLIWKTLLKKLDRWRTSPLHPYDHTEINREIIRAENEKRLEEVRLKLIFWSGRI